MKTNILKYIVIALMSVIGINVNASDVIFLNNGNVVIGNIVSKTDTIVKITADNGSTYEYPLIEVERISDTEIESVPSAIHKDKIVSYKDYSELNKGFWFSAEIGEALSCNITGGNYSFTEFDVVVGYRFSEYARLGVGVGVRYYNNNSHRFSNISWGMPLFATLRGNIIPSEYRNLVPYYSIDVGSSIRDGFIGKT